MNLFAPATRNKTKLRMALTGVSGSGKTLGAIYIAYGMTGDWSKIALIDTEHESGRIYADRGDLGTGQYLYASMDAPYSPQKYKDYVKAAADVVGSDGVVIIDSFSHAWDNEGGVLDIKTQIEQKSGKNSFTAWADAGKEQNSLVNFILSADCHTIVTMRSKTEYAMMENERGKMEPKKVGMAPVQRENTEYEFDIVLSIARNHIATTSKDRTFLDGFNAILSPDLGAQLIAWLDQGVEPVRERCEDCKEIIKATSKSSVAEVIEYGKKNAGKQLCHTCLQKWIKENKGENKT